jgi:hypothetical protein
MRCSRARAARHQRNASWPSLCGFAKCVQDKQLLGARAPAWKYASNRHDVVLTPRLPVRKQTV